jgi:hypothetical protein
MLWIIWSAAVVVVAQCVSRSAGVRTVDTARAERQRD